MNIKTEKPKFCGAKTDLKNSQNRKIENPNAPLFTRSLPALTFQLHRTRVSDKISY